MFQLDRSGFGIAHYAAARGETTVLRFLAAMGARCVDAALPRPPPPQHAYPSPIPGGRVARWVTICSHVPTIGISASCGGRGTPISLDLPDALNGDTPLIWAARSNQADAVQCLLELGANPFNTNSRQETAMFAAIAAGQKETAQLLLATASVCDRLCNRCSLAVWVRPHSALTRSRG